MTEQGWVILQKEMKTLQEEQTEQQTDCAWCLSEEGEEDFGDGSHGICKRHSDQVYANWKASRSA